MRRQLALLAVLLLSVLLLHQERTYAGSSAPSIVAPLSNQNVVIDGLIDLNNEYLYAAKDDFSTRDGLVIFYIQHDSQHLFIALDIDDDDYDSTGGDQVYLFFNLNNDDSYDSNDKDFGLNSDGSKRQGYPGSPTIDFDATFSLRSGGWKVEFSIPLEIFQHDTVGFNIRQSPQRESNYCWSGYGQLDVSKYGELRISQTSISESSYHINLRALDWSGNALASANVTISSIGSRLSNSFGWANFTGIFNGTYLVTTRWQGNTVNQTSITVSGSNVTTAVRSRVYNISFTNSFKDASGNPLYTNPSGFRLIAPNGTTTSFLSLGFYRLQNGTFRWNNIRWQGSNIAPSTSFDPVNGNPTVNCKVWKLSINAKDSLGDLLSPATTQIYTALPNGTSLSQTGMNTITYTVMNGTFFFAVKWQNSWVYGNTSTSLDFNTSSIDLYSKVFSLKLDFRDEGGKTLYSDPLSYSIACPNGSKIEGVSSFNLRVQNGTYTISDVMWQGTDITPVISKLAVSSNTLWTLNCRVYDIDLKIVDRYNNPLGNSRVEIRLANGTTKVYTTNSNGYVPHISQLQTGQTYVSSSNETQVFLVNKPLNIVRSGLYILKYVTYQLTIQALDSNGNPITGQPIEITFNNGTKRTFTLNGTGFWSNKDVPDGTMSWSIYFHGTKTNTTSIDLQRDTLIASRCQVYPLTLAFMDWNGTSTITPASYSITLPNGTIFAGRTALYYPQVQTGEVTVSSIVWRGSDVTLSDNKLALTSPTIWNIKSKVYKLQISVTDPTGITFSDVSVKLLKDGETFDQGKTDSLGQLLFSLPVGKYKVETIWKDCDVTPVDSTLTLTSSALWNVKCRIYKLMITVTDPLSMAVPDASVELVRDGHTFDQGLTNSLGQLSSYLPTGDYEVKTIHRGLTLKKTLSLVAPTSLNQVVYLSNSIILFSLLGVSVSLVSMGVVLGKRSKKHEVEMEKLWRDKVQPIVEKNHGVITPLGLQRGTDMYYSTSKEVLDWCRKKQLANMVRYLNIDFYSFPEYIQTSEIRSLILSSIMIADGGRRPIPKPVLYAIVQSGRKDITMVLFDQTLLQMVAEGILEHEPKTNSYSMRIKKTCPACRREVDEITRKCEYCGYEFL